MSFSNAMPQVSGGAVTVFAVDTSLELYVPEVWPS